MMVMALMDHLRPLPILAVWSLWVGRSWSVGRAEAEREKREEVAINANPKVRLEFGKLQWVELRPTD